MSQVRYTGHWGHSGIPQDPQGHASDESSGRGQDGSSREPLVPQPRPAQPGPPKAPGTAAEGAPEPSAVASPVNPPNASERYWAASNRLGTELSGETSRASVPVAELIPDL